MFGPQQTVLFLFLILTFLALRSQHNYHIFFLIVVILEFSVCIKVILLKHRGLQLLENHYVYEIQTHAEFFPLFFF